MPKPISDRFRYQRFSPQERTGVLEGTPPEEWLMKTILEHDDNQDSTKKCELSLPLKDDGAEYSLDDLYPDQLEVVTIVLDKIKQFIECKNLSNFKPLRLIINGAGGSGKSVIINTIVTCLRQMFNTDDVVRVVAPTGTAAFNVHGQTFHHLLGNRVTVNSYLPNTMSKSKKMKLIKKFKTLLALIVDERSLVSNVNLGTAARQIAETTFEGGPLAEHSFGGLPVVILAGDDFQLPSMEEGAIKILNYTEPKNKMTQAGREAFLECAKNVMSLQGSKRINDSRQDDKDLIANLRIATEKEMEDQHVQRLLNLRLDRMMTKHGTEVVKDIEDRAIFLFFKNEKRIRHNMKMLARQQNATNPVALIKAHSNNNKFGKGIASHFDSESPVSSTLCIGAKVAIDNKNFCPEWGLHNGACGTVKEMVFDKGHSPNNGNLPRYVIVEFPLYCGPAWDTVNPKVRHRPPPTKYVDNGFHRINTNQRKQFEQCVPIPVAEYSCSRATGCCRRTFMPLCLAYARTIHKFQGLTAGPVDEGKIKNMFDVIVCDPDDGKFENSALGLLYTAVSRATTLGDEDGMNSAIYFIGDHMTEARIRRIGRCKDSRNEFVRVGERRKWVNYLSRGETKNKFSKRKKQEIVEWAQSKKITYKTLADRIAKYVYDQLKPKRRSKRTIKDM